jgi:hypothetical protein
VLGYVHNEHAKPAGHEVVNRGLACLVLASSCGRVGFDPTPQTTGPIDAGAIDTPLVGSDAPLGSGQSWQLIQVVEASSGSGQSTLIAQLAPTRSGDLVVLATQATAPAMTTISDDKLNPYESIDASYAQNAPDQDSVELFYNPAVVADTTTVTFTSSTAAYTLVVWEFATAAPAMLDIGAALINEPASTMPSSPQLTTTSDGELVIATVIETASVTGIVPGAFTNDTLANANGWAHTTDPAAPAGTYQAQWFSGSGTYASNAAAFIVAP